MATSIFEFINVDPEMSLANVEKSKSHFKSHHKSFKKDKH